MADEEDKDTDVIRQQVPGEAVCWFNGSEFKDGKYVVSGSQLLQCSCGVWIEAAAIDAQPVARRGRRRRQPEPDDGPPSPSVRLPASSVPPCASTISRHSVRPSPLPAGLVE